MHPIGTKVYYTGDMANHDGFFTITGHCLGGTYDLTEDAGEMSHNRTMRGVYRISDTYDGTCRDRFVTAAARDAFRNARIEESKREYMRRAYLSKQSA